MNNVKKLTAPVSEDVICGCGYCTKEYQHSSDCAVHNMPALPNGKCDCKPPVSEDVDKASDEVLINFPFKGSLEQYANDCFKAGAEWQKQQPGNNIDKSIEFAEWINNNHYSMYWGSQGENCAKWYKAYSKPDRVYYTTKELYEQFLQSLK